MENENQNLIAALRYYDLGFSVIPVGRDKKPLVAWQQYQTTRSTKEQIEQWFKNPDVNVGVVTGAISGIVVIDVEAGGDVSGLPPTVVSKTGGGGWHFFYKYPNRTVQNGVRVRELTDIRGDGGYVVMPPSLHKSGNRYEWSIPPEDTDFAELPDWVLKGNTPTNDYGAIVPNGTRNFAAARVAGKLLGKNPLPQELQEIVWGAMKKWNLEKCDPPLDEKELYRTFESISGREAKKRQGEKSEYEISAIPMSELLDMEFPTPLWLVEKLIPHEAVTIISGAPASYKSFITLEIALKVAGGEKVFGEFQATKHPVLIVDEENQQRDLQTRIKLLSQNLDLPIYFASKGGFMLEENSIKKVVAYAKDKNVGLIIFDSLIDIHSAEENAASEMRNVMKHLKEIANNGIAVMVIHHHRKKGKDRSNSAQDIRGSSDILAQVDCHLAVDRKIGNAAVTIQQSKLRAAPEMETFSVTFKCDGSIGSFEYAGKAKAGQSKRSELKSSIENTLAEISELPNRTQLWGLVQKAGAKGGEATFKTAIKEMVDAGELFSMKGIKNSTLYSLKPFGADDG